LLWFRETASPEDLRAAVLKMIKLRFGPQPSEVEAAVLALVERAGPQQVLERVPTARSVAELLAEEA
jgi:hypothetical protein